jgi:hypothetical protein
MTELDGEAFQVASGSRFGLTVRPSGIRTRERLLRRHTRRRQMRLGMVYRAVYSHRLSLVVAERRPISAGVGSPPGSSYLVSVANVRTTERSLSNQLVMNSRHSELIDMLTSSSHRSGSSRAALNRTAQSESGRWPLRTPPSSARNAGPWEAGP